MDSDFSKVDPQDPPPEPEMSGPLASEFELEVSSSPSSELELSPPPTPSLDNPCIVITRIRAQDIAFPLNRVPVGFYVLVQVGGDQRRTQIKSIRLNDSSIKWEDEILLPFRAFENVRFTVYAPFELEPMLGNGEVLHTSESPIEELNNGIPAIWWQP
ncbi:hypothetical protein M404DRAFT_606963 [Pisolithus tinctorius Marx 270]|uniref:C2 domain-containing protein n=1 Tax=Pisolithus tinctorius Marx 270 TaxID=870435 RepID=A0A0C3J3X8_PISTI|nr:hypothetical protein M404DRAFT_606963 [Pisolithus tinctorius Marx 270]